MISVKKVNFGRFQSFVKGNGFNVNFEFHKPQKTHPCISTSFPCVHNCDTFWQSTNGCWFRGIRIQRCIL